FFMSVLVVDGLYSFTWYGSAGAGQVLHRGKAKTLTRRQWRWIKRRQAVEPVIGHLKDDCRLRRCRLKGAQGDALHVLGCAAGYNLRWLLRWIAFLRAWMRAMGWPSFSAVPLSPMTLGA
ncbi:transposase, partial [Xanthomonas campestris]|uniref:transposase n=1 Tax=Xanthomonas campestris TaxID=339 RepID=UPI0020A152E6